MPALPAARRVARAGRAREAGRVRGRGVLGPAAARVRRSRTPRSSSSASRPPPTAATAPGRVFTGDRSGDWLFAALHRAGLGQPAAVGVARRRPAPDRLLDDGRGALRAARQQADCPWSATPACPGRWPSCDAAPTPRVVVCSARFAWDAALRLRAALGEPVPRPRPRFGHGAELPGETWTLLGCFHPSQQNTFTGKLDRADARRGLRACARARGTSCHLGKGSIRPRARPLVKATQLREGSTSPRC